MKMQKKVGGRGADQEGGSIGWVNVNQELLKLL